MRIRRGVVLGIASIVFIVLSLLNGRLRPVAPEDELTLFAGVIFAVLGLTWWWQGTRKALFLFITYAVVFGALEGGFRLWVNKFATREQRNIVLSPYTATGKLRDHSAFVPHHYTLYNLRPGFSTEAGTRFNRLGLRDDRPLDAKPDGTIRVVTIGGSTTQTILVDDNRRIYTARLEGFLRDTYEDILPETEIEVVNAGMAGATSAENLLRLIFFVSEVKPDLVVIHHGLNDSWPRLYPGMTSDFSNYRRSMAPPNNFGDRSIVYGTTRWLMERSMLLTGLARKLRWFGQTEVGDLVRVEGVDWDERFLAENDTRYFERNTRYMLAICRAMGAEVVLVTEAVAEGFDDDRDAAVHEHNELLRRIAEDEGVGFFDFFSVMTQSRVHMPDGKHMSQIGSDLKADLFFEYFREAELIPRLAGAPTSGTLERRQPGG